MLWKAIRTPVVLGLVVMPGMQCSWYRHTHSIDWNGAYLLPNGSTVALITRIYQFRIAAMRATHLSKTNSKPIVPITKPRKFKKTKSSVDTQLLAELKKEDMYKSESELNAED